MRPAVSVPASASLWLAKSNAPDTDMNDNAPLPFVANTVFAAPSEVGYVNPPAVKFVAANVVRVDDPLPVIFPVTLPVIFPVTFPVKLPEKLVDAVITVPLTVRRN